MSANGVVMLTVARYARRPLPIEAPDAATWVVLVELWGMPDEWASAAPTELEWKEFRRKVEIHEDVLESSTVPARPGKLPTADQQDITRTARGDE